MHTVSVKIPLQNIHEFGFNQQSIPKLSIFAGDNTRLPALSYTNPLQVIFNLNAAADNNELDYSNSTTNILQEIIPTIFLHMKKLFPINWTHEVFCKFLLINIKSPDVLFCH